MKAAIHLFQNQPIICQVSPVETLVGMSKWHLLRILSHKIGNQRFINGNGSSDSQPFLTFTWYFYLFLTYWTHSLSPPKLGKCYRKIFRVCFVSKLEKRRLWKNCLLNLQQNWRCGTIFGLFHENWTVHVGNCGSFAPKLPPESGSKTIRPSERFPTLSVLSIWWCVRFWLNWHKNEK